VQGLDSNLTPLIDDFPGWTLEQWDNKWCAAFVYHCVKSSGFNLESKTDEYHFAGCESWDKWGKSSDKAVYIEDVHNGEIGDIVLYDRVFNGREHDHIGIVIEKSKDSYTVAEGNINNVSGIVERKINDHIRCFIRIVG
jgi:hypothetical protein